MTQEDLDRQAREFHANWISEGNLRSLEDAFPVSEADAPVLLFEGQGFAITPEGEKSGDLRIELTWSLRPRVVFTLNGVESRLSGDQLNAFTSLRPSILAEPIGVRIETYSPFDLATATFAGVVTEDVTSADSACTQYAMFHVPNFLKLLPARAIYRESGEGYSGRTVFSALGWKITLDITRQPPIAVAGQASP